jgi:L-lactate dehydrogenase complex protein LldG
MSSRQQILDRIAQQLGGERTAARDRVRAWMESGEYPPIPARGQLQGEARLAKFEEMARLAHATTERVCDRASAIAAIVRLGEFRGFGPELSLSGSMADWREALEAAGFELNETIPEVDGAVVLTDALAGVAETGTLVVTSGAHHPHSLNILAQKHLVVLPVASVLANYEEAWRLCDQRYPEGLPRTVLWITGPSRTGDIEQTMQLGAHGPKLLHILLLED